MPLTSLLDLFEPSLTVPGVHRASGAPLKDIPGDDVWDQGMAAAAHPTLAAPLLSQV